MKRPAIAVLLSAVPHSVARRVGFRLAGAKTNRQSEDIDTQRHAAILVGHKRSRCAVLNSELF